MENKKKFVEELGKIFMMYSMEKVEEFKYFTEVSNMSILQETAVHRY